MDRIAAAREAIRDTMSRYNQYGDADLAEEFAGVFTPDAVFEAVGLRLAGRAAILEWKRGHAIFAATSFRMHHVSSIVVDVEGDEAARGIANWLVTTDVGLDHCGRYHDRFVRVGGSWLIAHRRVDVLWTAADSVLRSSPA